MSWPRIPLYPPLRLDDDIWGPSIMHNGTSAKPETLAPDDIIIVAYNPVENQTWETWAYAAKRARRADDDCIGWDAVTAYRRKYHEAHLKGHPQ